MLKKILFLFFVSAFDVRAVPISTSSISNLQFGSCVQGDGVKVVVPGTSENASNGSFQVNGNASVSFTVILPSSATITTAGGGVDRTLIVSSFQSFPSGSSGILSPSGMATVYVGATLSAISTSQVPGAYSGNFIFTVMY